MNSLAIGMEGLSWAAFLSLKYYGPDIVTGSRVRYAHLLCTQIEIATSRVGQIVFEKIVEPVRSPFVTLHAYHGDYGVKRGEVL